MLGAKYPTIVQSLLDRGADVAAADSDSDGDTALDSAISDQSVLRAGSRLHSIDLLARAIGRVDVSSVKRSLDRAIELARRSRIHHQVLIKLEMRPVSENILQIRMTADQSEAHQAYLRSRAEFTDLEITEIELADRIVAILRDAVAGAE